MVRILRRIKMNNDSELIQYTLDGDQTAFTKLVEKYHKGIHALVWRKIGDFHIAEEITQDTFLRAYKRLRTLKDRSLFPGWIYVIASHLCIEWHRKKHLPIQSLENTDISEIDQVSHTRYMIDKRDTETTETLREIVEKLLKKLPESERTVMTLHYLGEMTCESISKMLGVSLNTVKSRLNRARNRLKKEEAIIQEHFSSLTPTTNLVENITKEISKIKPTTPSTNKPFLPWVVSTTSAILVLLLFGFGIQFLSTFSQPYDINSDSELMVEIIDAPINLTRKIKSDPRNQIGNTDTPSKSRGSIDKLDTPKETDLTEGDQTPTIETPLLTQQWTQRDSPEAVKVSTLSSTKTNDIYAMTPIGLYRMADNNEEWNLVNNKLPTSDISAPIVEHNGILYIPTVEAILTSKDKGKTWKSLCTYPKGKVTGLIVKDNAEGSIDIYIGLLRGIFFSDNAGSSWTPLNKGLALRKVYVITSIENTLFAGTDRGLFRLILEPSLENGSNESDVWKQLPVAKSLSIHAIKVSDHRLYLLAGLLRISSDIRLIGSLKAVLGKQPLWSVFRSTDYGESWTDITPKDSFDRNQGTANLTIVAAEKTVILIGHNTLRSNDQGNTWVSVDKTTPLGGSFGQNPVAVLKVQSNNNSYNQQQSTKYQYYIGNDKGIHRLTDGGSSWKRFNSGLGGKIENLTAFHNKLYAIANEKLITSTDGGQSWETIPVNADDMNTTFFTKKIPLTYEKLQQVTDIRQIIKADGVLYGKGFISLQIHFFRLDEHNQVLIPIQGVPTLDEKNMISGIRNRVFLGAFAISENRFYLEHKRKLLIWHASSQVNNNASWYDTKIEDTRNFAIMDPLTSFTLGVSGDTVYVGIPDGVLLHSVDSGKNWEIVSLPISVEAFKQIHITDEVVWIATDKGTLYSNDGIKWNIITNSSGQQLVFDRFVMDGTALYAVSSSKDKHGGVYQLTSEYGTWERITPEIPDDATSIAVLNGTLYVGTENSGLQITKLADPAHSLSTKY